MPKTLTPKQLSDWDENGFILPFTLFRPGQMAGYVRRLEALKARHPDIEKKLYASSNLLAPWLYDLTCVPAFMDVVEDLIGPDILCLSSEFRFKEPNDGVYAGWHQDKRYLAYEPVWISGCLAVTDCTEANGCLRVIPGSHKWGLLDHEDTRDQKSILTRGQRITAAMDTSETVPIVLKAGQAMIFHNSLVHASEPNRTDGRRIVCLMTFCPPETKPPRDRESVALLRGIDPYGHWDIDPRPEQEFGEAEFRRHRDKLVRKHRASYAGSDRTSPAIQ